uniref:Uncharacterized protein n=1 Tax=Helicotheca tamesis TaxID=374047 RepID=A0A7S2HNP0_9STRA|eukprot:CAMPEP_0185736726 /NCGR_PEP_ID=MMETSP1171-20130828/28634_1 /TAXON_ID=374046 /ORGANISM="Helicotheca tamensis, Strain CCMP826" /LENGTH=440 /DNA_ID=CAMNT_0028407437 /DNA_START=97 /DNA_END=1419 /DNA_ORIENTATION=+
MTTSGKDDKKKQSAPSCAYGSLPADIGEIPKVTSAPDSKGPARSVGVAPMASSAPVGFGPSSFGPSLGFPSTQGTKLGGPTPFNKAQPGAKLAPLVTSTVPAWNVTDESLPKLPDFHPLERTAVFTPHTRADIIAKRVFDCLRTRSITAEFNDEKARAKCVSPENVEFRVRLYRGKGKFDNGVITEVQRRYGFSVCYNDDVAAILDAAEGKSFARKESKPLPLVSDSEDEAVETKVGTKRKASMVRIASDMLKKSKTIDANVISMRSLESLTDSSKMGSSTALRVSTQILAGSEDAGGFEIRDAVLSLLVNHRLVSDPNNVVEDEETLSSLRYSAMAILSNVVGELQKTKPHILQEQGPIVAKAVLPVLLKEIQGAEENIRMAVLACRCLKALSKSIGGSEEILAIKEKALKALYSAQDIGDSRHANLEQEARACIAVLE